MSKTGVIITEIPYHDHVWEYPPGEGPWVTTQAKPEDGDPYIHNSGSTITVSPKEYIHNDAKCLTLYENLVHFQTVHHLCWFYHVTNLSQFNMS